MLDHDLSVNGCVGGVEWTIYAVRLRMTNDGFGVGRRCVCGGGGGYL